MTEQVEELLYDIEYTENLEEHYVILKTYIEQLEQRIKEYESMIDWMERYSNKGLDDYYNREDTE